MRPWYNRLPQTAIEAAMPVRQPVFSPPFNVVRASHVELTVRDLARSRAFYVDCLGYLVSAEEPDALYLRAVEERNHHSIVLRKGKEPAAHALGFKVASEEDLDRAADWFRRRNLPTAFPEVPYQGRTLRTADVTGMPLEFYFKMDQGERMLQRYAAYQGARIQRIDHINCFTPDVQASYDFYTELGFRLTEYTETDDTRDPQALGGVAAPQGQRPRPRLHQRPRAAAASHRRLDGGPARHPAHLRRDGDLGLSRQHGARTGPARHLERVLSLYPRSGRPPHRAVHQRLSHGRSGPRAAALVARPIRSGRRLWGHPAPKSWFEEGSEFPSVPVREPVLEARPVVAR